MKMSGNAKSDTIRARSRSSLMRSRCASVRTAATSLTGSSFPTISRYASSRLGMCVRTSVSGVSIAFSAACV